MGPLFVITLQPFCADPPHLLPGFNHIIGVQHFRAIGPMLSLDEGMLIRLPRLNISKRNRPFCPPGDEAFGDKFRPIVQPNRLWLAPPGHHLLQHAEHALRRERCVNFDRQAVPHAFIQHIPWAESPAAV
jgi:hypothetical protein